MDKIARKIFLGLLIFLICYLLYGNYTIYHTKIEGVIESVSYNRKGFPNVVINGETYGLPFGQEEIKVGDSISKSPQSYWLFQFRDGEKINAFEW